MNRSTNFLYNTRHHIPDPFTTPFSYIPNPMRGFPQQYSFRDTNDPRRQTTASSAPEGDITSNTSNRVNVLQPRRMHEENQKSSLSPYTQFFSNSGPTQPRPKSRFSQDIKDQDVSSHSEHISPRNLAFYTSQENYPLTEAFRNNQLNHITRHRFMTPTPSQNYHFNSKRSQNGPNTAHSLFRYNSEETSAGIGCSLHQGSSPPFELLSLQSNGREGSPYSWSEKSEKSTAQIMSPRFQRVSQQYSEGQDEIKEVGEERSNPRAEELLEKIEKYELNPISLLNEVSGKLKKRIEYKTTESTLERTKIFKCVCLFDGQVIGTQKGTSKQSAKTEAAYKGVRCILTEENYLTESAALLLSIQKASEKALRQEKHEKASGPQSTSSHKSVGSSSDIPNQQVNSKSDAQGAINEQHLEGNGKIQQNLKASLYELGSFSRKYEIEPIWSFPIDSTDHECQLKLQFGGLIVEEKGKNKQETKKEAALRMIEKIKEAELVQSSGDELTAEGHHLILHGKAVSSASHKTFCPKRVKKSRKLFETSLKPNLLEYIESQAKISDTHIQDANIQLEKQILSTLNRYKIDPLSTENLQNFFKKIMDYTSMITSYPKQVMLDAIQHPADYIKDCYLIPMGSFGLGCMRNDKLTIDSLLTFQKMHEISELELLELYKNSLETCYSLDQKSGTNTINMNYQFNIKTNTQGTYMEVTETGKTHGRLKINIFMIKQSNIKTRDDPRNGLNLSALWVYRMYKCFEHSLEELNFFRNLLTIMKIWRRKAELHSVRPEIIDTILLDVFITQKPDKINESIIKSLTILSSEKLTNALLSKVDKDFFNLYQDLPVNVKDNLIETSKKSLEHIFKNDLVVAKLC